MIECNKLYWIIYVAIISGLKLSFKKLGMLYLFSTKKSQSKYQQVLIEKMKALTGTACWINALITFSSNANLVTSYYLELTHAVSAHCPCTLAHGS